MMQRIDFINTPNDCDDAHHPARTACVLAAMRNGRARPLETARQD
jgi:hypothetical protein